MKKILQKFGLLTCILFIGMLVQAQELQITGNVTDENGEPLPGVAIVEEGTTNGTVTNFDGVYTLGVSPEAENLIFSFVGMQKNVVPINNQTVIDLVMKSESIGMDEIVVVGYGTQKKVNLTGAVAVLDTEALENRPVPNTLSMLQGQMPGVQLTTPGGQPGADQPIIRIRGAVSIGTDSNNTSKNNPLVLIDGVQATLSDFGRINPNEIESISVLKDAASSSIYGTRAAGGVILVTTKQGVKGKVNIVFNAYTGIQEAVVLPEFVDSWDYAILKNEARVNAGKNPYFTQETIDNLKNGTDPDLYANTKWFDELFSTGTINKYDLSVSGGSDKVSYAFSGGYLDQKGVMLKQSANRVNYRSNIKAKLSDKITMGLNLWGYRSTAKRAYSSSGDIIRRAYFSQPLIPVRWTTGVAEGELAGYTELGSSNPKGVQNPVQRAINGENVQISDKFSAQINTEIKLLKGLKYNSVIAYTVNNKDIAAYRPLINLTRFSGAIASQSLTETKANRSNLSEDQYQIDNILNYENTFGDHAFNALVGHSFIDYKADYFSASGRNLPGDLEILDVAVDDFAIGGWRSDWSLLSYFARLNYIFKDKYLFEANLRKDASSRFPDENKWATFPSFSIGWKVSEEAFMQNIDFINNFKVRAGWGMVGNDQISNYPHDQTFNFSQFYVDNNGNLLTGAAITSISNSLLQWEETTSKNIGIDLGLFRNKLEVSVDYFDNNSNGILTQLPLPSIFGGVSEPYQNAASVSNSGIEFLVGYRDHIGKFKYSINANLSTLNNEVTDFNGQESIDGKRIIREGDPINAFYGLDAIGIFQSPEEVTNHAFQSNTTAPGDLIYRDVDGSGTIDENDRVVIGKPIPGVSYGFTLGTQYEGFDFSAFFQGVSDVDFYAYGWGNDAVRNPRTNTITDWLDRWTEDDPSTTMIRIVSEEQNNKIDNSYWLRNGSYLRLKNIQLGYTLNSETLNKVGFKSVRFYVSGQNLLTWSKVEDWDPEQLPSTTNMSQHPQLKTWAVGINAKF